MMETYIVLLNLAAYSSLGVGLLQLSRQRGAHGKDPNELFPLLAVTLRRAFPDLPASFTWREGMSRARAAGLQLRWDEIDATMTAYESYRYGGGPAPGPFQPETTRLLDALRGYRR